MENLSHFEAVNIYVKEQVLLKFIAYILPVGILLSLLNNLVVIFIFLFGPNTQRTVSKSLCVYYIAIALSDINSTVAAHLTYFLGMNPHLFQTSIVCSLFAYLLLLGYGLYELSDGIIYILWDTYSNLFCKFRAHWYLSSSINNRRVRLYTTTPFFQKLKNGPSEQGVRGLKKLLNFEYKILNF